MKYTLNYDICTEREPDGAGEVWTSETVTFKTHKELIDHLSYLNSIRYDVADIVINSSIDFVFKQS